MDNKQRLFSVGIHDCEVQTFRCPGKGGQNVNKLETGVRIIHAPSGVVTKSTEGRSQWANKQVAWRRLGTHPDFVRWAKAKASVMMGGLTPEQIVDRAMDLKNIKVEVKNEEGRWTDEINNSSDDAVDTN